MQTFVLLYQQNPAMCWLVLAALFVALDIASGSGILIWVALSACAAGLLALLHVRSGMALQTGLFAVLSAASIALSLLRARGSRRDRMQAAAAPEPPRAEQAPAKQTAAPASAAQSSPVGVSSVAASSVRGPRATAHAAAVPQAFSNLSTLSGSTNPSQPLRMVGRIGRTSGAFLNGRGRVWIDGREWPAEVEGGEANLRSDTPVRVLAVAGGDQLRVRGLIA